MYVKYAVISDVHGNSEALRATITSAISSGCNAFIFLGDYGTDFCEIHEVLEMIRWCQKNYPTYVIKGNREDYIIDYLDGKHPDWEKDPTRKALFLNISNMTDDDINYIRSLPRYICTELYGIGKVIMSHTLNLVPELQEEIDAGKVNILLFGHSHSSGNWYSSGCNIYNPGSAGLSDDRVNCTYGILDKRENKCSFEIKIVEYNLGISFELLNRNEELSGAKAGYKSELLKMSLIIGQQMTVHFLVELQRLNAIRLKALEKNVDPDYSPLDDYETLFLQLKNVNVDQNGIYLPIFDYSFRNTFNHLTNQMLVDKPFSFGVPVFEKSFKDMPNELVDVAYKNMCIYFFKELERRREIDKSFSALPKR